MTVYGTLERGRDCWVLNAQPHIHQRAKRVFGRLKFTADKLELSHSLEVCRDLAWFMERYPLQMSDVDRKALHDGAQQHRDYISGLEQLVDPNYEPPDVPLVLPPRTYQKRGSAICLQTGGTLIADDVGLGKTTTAICVITNPLAMPAVVVTLTHLPKQWASEIRKFAPALNVHCVKNGELYDLPRFMGHGPDVIVLSYSKLDKWAKVLSGYAKSVVFDEVQELRHDDSAKYRGAALLASAARVRLGLSATPIYNYGGEIFNILELLKPGSLGTWPEFLQEWCTYGGKNACLKDSKAFGSWAREQFLIVRHTRKEVGRELPPVTRVVQGTDCDTAELHKVEASASELARLILAQNVQARGDQWRAAQELSLLLRQATGIAKAPFVADFVRLLVSSGEPVVVFAWHREVYRILQSKLADLNPVMYTGTESPVQKALALHQFQIGHSKVFLMSLRSGAGLNGLQEVSKVCVFAELDWSPGVHEQNIGRVARDGQDDSVVAYFMVSEEGSDPVVAEMNGIKREQAEGIRNPGEDTLERLEVGAEQAKRLAVAYLAQIGQSSLMDLPLSPLAQASEAVS